MAEILIEGRRLDVMKGLDFSFNYSIADIRDPNKRSTNYSKTIKCPSTKNNDALFGQIWSVNISNPYNANDTNIETNFNPNKKAQALVVQDGVTVMSGVVQLRAVTIQNGVYNYEVVFIGKLIDFFSAIGKSKLRDIDFSDLNHVYDKPTIISSWTNSTYTYPMLDFGDDYDYSNGLKVYRVTQFRPALYAKEIWDRVFSFAGFSYTSSLLTSSPFTNLVVPFSGEQIFADDAATNLRKFRASLTSAEGAYSTSDFFGNDPNVQKRIPVINDDSTGENFDTGNNYNTSNYIYTVPNDGLYGFDFSFDMRLVRTTINANRIYNGNLKIIAQILKQDLSLNTSVIGEATQSFAITNNPSSFDQTLTVSATAEEQLLLDGESIFFRLVVDYNDLTVVNALGQAIDRDNLLTDFDMTLPTATVSSNPSNVLFEGDTVPMNSVVPDMTIEDFVMSIIKMFNLYVTIDELNENNLIIETRDQYYSSGVTRDWTYKLARDKKTEIKPIGLLSAKVYEYKYKEDSDYYNERFQTSYDEPYGTRRYEVDNDFLTNKKEVEISFAPTPLNIDGNSNRFVSRIYDSDISEGAKPTEAKPRILYFDNKQSNPDWLFRSDITGADSTILQYPYAGHLDDPITPTLDINFGIPDELFYQQNANTGTLQYTNANLFNLYHSAHIEEVTDKDSKVLTGYFYLEPLDIQKLDFRDQIVIDNSYWRINKVSDYNPFKEGLTKVELIKVLEPKTLETETFTFGIVETIGNAQTKENKPTNNRRFKNRNQYNPVQGKVHGRGNTISPQAFNFKVIGDNNFIGDSAKNVSIIGSSNYVSSGIENVVIINSDNQEVTESNTTIIDGKRIWQYVSIDSDYTANDRDFVLADATSGAVTVTLSTEGSSDHWVNVKKIDASANAVTVEPDSGTIDGSANITLSSQYDAVDVYSDGTNWHIR